MYDMEAVKAEGITELFHSLVPVQYMQGELWIKGTVIPVITNASVYCAPMTASNNSLKSCPSPLPLAKAKS